MRFKQKNLFLLLFIFFSTSIYVNAQKSGDFIKANKAFDNLEYSKAEVIYKRAYSRSDDRSEKNEISFKLAQCYYYLGNYKKAESNFRRTLKMRYENSLVHYFLGECYKSMEKFDKAEEQYVLYADLEPEDIKAKQALESLRLSQDWILDGSKYRVVNAGSKINSKANDFAPFFRDKKNEDLFFTSSREEALGKSLNEKTGQRFTDIFVIKKKGDNGKSRKKSSKSSVVPPEWDETTLTNINDGLKDIVNLKNSDEGVMSFNKRGNKMLFTRAVFEKNKYQGRRIYSTTFRGKKFRDVVMEKIPVDTLVDVHGPSISADEKTLFFSAEIDGGFGGADIYVTRYDRRKKAWGDPENLGENINTAGNEGFPYYSDDTKNLYFSSDGRLGMGGLDIYKAPHNPDSDGSISTLFLESENLKYPINTCYDDFSIVFESTNVGSDTEPELKGFFSSNRVGNKWKSKGNTDIYYFDKQQIFFTLSGKVLDVADGSPMKGAQVELIGPSSSKIAHTNGFGEFSFDDTNFEENQDYRLVINKDWFFQQVDTTITTKNISKRDCTYIEEEGTRKGHLSFDMYRGPIEMRTMRRPLVLKSVLFDTGKSDLRDESKEELDSLASLLTKDWSKVVVELRSHTDFRGSDTLNTRLSYDRALSCVEYLVEKGVDSRRLVPVGMASLEPVVLEEAEFNLPVGVLDKEYILNLKNKKSINYAHQKNRRTDFKVLSDNFNNWIKENPIDLEIESSPIKRATIDEEGKVEPLDNTINKKKGNYIQEVN
ncbi:OmpA family protein [Flavobacteriales bacterium]|nr:OmpA family protein [Flavobacteriales bacterium]